MSLKSKLARLRNAGPGSQTPAASPSPSEAEAPPLGPPTDDESRRERAARMQGVLARMIGDEKRRLRDREPAAPAPPPMELPGEVLDTSLGRMHRVTQWLEPAHHHGSVPIVDALRCSPVTIAKLALDETLSAIDPRRVLFIDTETTGLAGGTGTIPFLIGLAWFEDESLRIEQLLLRAPGEEAPMLQRLGERLKWASAIVSYNGKSYDWPLLRTRFVLNRVPVVPPPAHLDLLHCARRVFKRRLGRVRLVNMEEHVLDMRREGDIDGSEIPQRFWDFIRGADASLLSPVIEHNANDLVALAAILVSLVDRYEQLRPEHEPADQLGIAHVAARADDASRADLYARAAADGGGPGDVTADALWLSAELARRRADHETRRALLARGLEVSDDARRAARFALALAKDAEHVLKDYERALVHAAKTDVEEGEPARDHRVARILRKLARQRAQEQLPD